MDDTELIAAIKEYEKTVFSRHGTVGGNISYAEQELVVKTAYLLHSEMRQKNQSAVVK